MSRIANKNQSRRIMYLMAGMGLGLKILVSILAHSRVFLITPATPFGAAGGPR